MVNAWMQTVKDVKASMPKGTLLKDILKKAKLVYRKSKKGTKVSTPAKTRKVKKGKRKRTKKRGTKKRSKKRRGKKRGKKR